MKQKRKIDLFSNWQLYHWLLCKISDLVADRYPKAVCYRGHMQKIARKEFGVILIYENNLQWGHAFYVIDDKLLTMALLKFY